MHLTRPSKNIGIVAAYAIGTLAVLAIMFLIMT